MLPALIGAMLTLAIFMAGVVFRMGHQAARIEALENWRGSIRQDMHEISAELGGVKETLERLTTLIEERTQRVRQDDDVRRVPPRVART